jgi:hypothetical protein
VALVIETGAGISNAESFATVAQLRTYAVANGATLPTKELDCEILLRKAMLALRRGEDFIGCKWTKEQALDWPRAGVVINEFPYAADELPDQLVEAQCILAIEAQTSALLPTVKANAPGAVVEKTVGPITTRYSATSKPNDIPIVSAAERVLAPLLRAKGGSIPLIRS